MPSPSSPTTTTTVTPDALLAPERLAAVAELALEEAGQQAVFGHLNDLARQLLGVPVSAVSLITGTRQVSLGQSGQDDDRHARLEVPLSAAVCTLVARSGQAMVIDDALADPAVADHLGVRDYGIAAYAGAPLRLAGGEVVGAFCAIDTQPRTWSTEELQTLSKLTAVAATLLDQRRHLVAAELRDAVTGLPRLPLFQEHLRDLLQAAEPHEQVAVIALDLRDFSLLNDAWGHAGGDAVLADVGLRLEQVVHRRRAPGHVCRLAGDTFLLAGLVGRGEPRDRLQYDVLGAVTGQPVRHDGREQHLSARAATVLPEPLEAPERVAARAKAAVRQLAGDEPEASTSEKRRRLTMRNKLWTALEREELELHYQPIYDLAESSVVGFEALLRWNSPELGTVPPVEFIPEAERSGAIVAIGEWAIEQGLRDLVRWRATTPDRALTLSVNVAPEQLLIRTFASSVAAALAAADLPASALIVEVTERTLGATQPAILRSLHELRALGVRISVDDFGAGSSSIGRLAALPLDEVKIDRSFIAAMDGGPRSRDLVGSLIGMAHALGLTTVAEGVETQDQHRELAALGCGSAQGYLMARPAPASSIADTIRHG